MDHYTSAYLVLNDGRPPQRLPDGTLVPSAVKARVAMPDFDVTLEVHLVHGAAICTRIEVKQWSEGTSPPPPITQTALQAIPVGRIAQEALAWTSDKARAWRAETEPDVRGGRRWHPEADPLADVIQALAPRKKGRAADPAARAALRQAVVSQYLELVHAGSRGPKPLIAKSLNISGSYVGSLLGEARKLGELASDVRPGRPSLEAGTRP